MKILIISDSHGNFDILKKVIDREQPEMLIHAGDLEDMPMNVEAILPQGAASIYIRGNCDYVVDKDFRKSALFKLCGHTFYVTHGHRLGVSAGLTNLFYTAAENGADIAIYGHTHIPFDDEDGGVHVLNPGSCSLPRGGSRKTYMIMNMSENGEYEVSLRLAETGEETEV